MASALRGAGALWVLALWACSQPAGGSAVPEPPAVDPAARGEGVADAAPEAPPISEIEARVLLAAMFRDAGYRILYDRTLVLGGARVAVDGYDPQRRVGFEYIAAPEVGVWSGEVGPDEPRILVVGPAPRRRVSEAARAFLAALPAPE